MSIRIRAILTIVLANLVILSFSVSAAIYVRTDIEKYQESNLTAAADINESPFRNIDRGLILVGIVGFIINIIAAVIASNFIKKPFEEIAALKEAAEANSRTKSNFLANMSHEIRTPMNAIIGITEILLREDALEPHIKESLFKIYSSSDLLLNIINDILDLSKIEAGKLELAPVKYETASMINDTVTLNMMRIGSKQIEFKLSMDANVPATLFGDELRVKQILNNLLSNAFKYTENGSVKLSVSASPGAGESDSEVTLEFIVSDTGHGMTKEQIGMLFDRYTRFNEGANRTTEGAGLGMGITWNLVQMMKGSISVESELHKGTVVAVHIPQRREGSEVIGVDLANNLQQFHVISAKQLKSAQIIIEPLPYGSVLIVDDVESNLYVAKGLLTPYGLKIDTAMSGSEAIDKIKAGCVYDIVFMDHMMPKMDGIEATRIIRETGYKQPIVALTANAVVGQSELFFASGFDDFISKPIDMRRLNSALKKFIRNKKPNESGEAAQRRNNVKEAQAVSEVTQVVVSRKLAGIIVREVSKAVSTLEAILDKRGAYDDEDIKGYRICVHGLKSSMANIGEPELSAHAAILEHAARDKDASAISSKTPAFLDDLRAVIDKYTPKR